MPIKTRCLINIPLRLNCWSAPRQANLSRSATWFVAIFAVCVWLAGCASGTFSRARGEIAAGNYVAAHQEFQRAAENPTRLPRRERRELDDGLCLTEYKIGAPSYSLAEQQRACAEAAALDQERGGPILEEVERNRRAALGNDIANSLAAGDISEAEHAIRDYQAEPGADRAAVKKWSQQVWTLVRQRDHQASKKRIAPAISAVARRYPKVHAMNDHRFREWVERNTTIAGTQLVTHVEIGRRSVNLWIPDDRRGAAALNLDRFALVNNALVARCRCDGHTTVALTHSGLPAYLVRLDPETRQSEIIILSSQ